MLNNKVIFGQSIVQLIMGVVTQPTPRGNYRHVEEGESSVISVQ